MLVLDKDDLTVTASTITHTFTQEETARFYVGAVEVQIKAMTADGTVISHDPVSTFASVIFDERVFSDGQI